LNDIIVVGKRSKLSIELHWKQKPPIEHTSGVYPEACIWVSGRRHGNNECWLPITRFVPALDKLCSGSTPSYSVFSGKSDDQIVSYLSTLLNDNHTYRLEIELLRRSFFISTIFDTQIEEWILCFFDPMLNMDRVMSMSFEADSDVTDGNEGEQTTISFVAVTLPPGEVLTMLRAFRKSVKDCLHMSVHLELAEIAKCHK
jgi:hypothetical protein